jgi:hypothetical protein
MTGGLAIGLSCLLCGWYVEPAPGELVSLPRRCPYCGSALVIRESGHAPHGPPPMTRVPPHPTLDQIERGWR